MSLPTLCLITPRVLYTLVLFSIRTNNCDFYVPFPPKSHSFLILAAKTEKKPQTIFNDLFIFSQPSHNDKYSNQEMIQVMNELAKARKQLKGTFLPAQQNNTSSPLQTTIECKNS